MSNAVLGRIESGLNNAFGSDFVGYTAWEILSDGTSPSGSTLVPPGDGKVYMRDDNNKGWLLVPADWARNSSGMTTGRNPSTGREEPQLMPPGISKRGTHFGQPYYSDSEAYGGSGGPIRVERAPLKLPSRQITVDSSAPSVPASVVPFQNPVGPAPNRSKAKTWWLLLPIGLALLAFVAVRRD